MRSFVRSLSVVAALALAASTLASPAVSAPDRTGPKARVADRAIVRGRDAGTREPRPTSFDVYSRRGRAAAGATKRGGATAPRDPLETFGFAALADLDGAVPSDTIGALGDTFFVTATNVRIAVYDRTGAEVVAPTLLESLHPDSENELTFDPKVVYDQYDDTFVLVYLVLREGLRQSRIVAVAIPNATANDPGTWCATSFPGDLVPGDGKLWADYPGLGYTEDRVTITSNQFTFPKNSGRFRYAQILSISKDELYDCSLSEPVPTVFAGTRTLDENGIQAFTLQPAQTVGSPAKAQFLVSVQLAGRNTYLALWRVKDTARGPILKNAVVPVGRANFPPVGTQAGGSLVDDDTWWDAGDDRLINAFYDADRDELFTAHAVGKDLRPDVVTGAYPEAAVRWYEIDPARRLARSTLERRGIIGTPESDLGWPSVATDGEGNLFVTYSRASEPNDEFLSAWVAEVPAGSTKATQVLLEPGLATYDAIPGIERWGDYTGINRDPIAPAVMATFNQYALDPTTWQQVVHLVSHG